MSFFFFYRIRVQCIKRQTIVSPPFNEMWYSKRHFLPEGKTAVIVGGSQGVGYEIALQLADKGCTVVLVARTESKLKAKAALIEAETNSTAEYLACDVSDYDLCEHLWAKLDALDLDPDYLFCCAGSAVPKLFGDMTKDDLNQGVDLNYRTAANMCHTWWGRIRAEGKPEKPRHIVLFSSVLGWFPFIGYGQYAPMKQAVASLLVILRQELSPFGFRVLCVFAGNFLLEGYDEEQKTKPEITKIIEGPLNPITGQECAATILDQLAKGYDTITTDFIGWVLWCSVLGVFVPRKWNFFQVIMLLLLAIVGPMVNLDINKKIYDYFATQKAKTTKLE